MKKWLLLALWLALLFNLLVVGAGSAMAQGPTLPDWGSSIASQTNGFLAWSAISGPVQFMIGIASGAVGIALLMRIFLRGG